MTQAFFDYNPVGPSLFMIQEEGQEPHETTISAPDGNSIIESICGLMADVGVEKLYCDKNAMELAPSIKQYILRQYNNNTLIIEQY